MAKQLSFIDKQRIKGGEVADFALTLTEDALHARILCMEAARQLNKCTRKEKEKDETTKPKRKRVRLVVPKKHAAVRA